MGKNEENWMMHYEALKAYIQERGHLPDKHSRLNNWVRYQRKCIKAGTLSEEQTLLFQTLAASRSNLHTGGRRKKIE